MDILIHTYGRATLPQQHTLQALLSADILPTLVIQHREIDLYGWYKGPIHVLPPHLQTLSPTRDYLIHDKSWKDDKVVFFDDDLHFFVRRKDDRTKFAAPTADDLRRMVDSIAAQLAVQPHVGIAPREGGNRNTQDSLLNTRIMRVLGYRRSYLREKNITFTPLVVMEDFHVNLQVLESGADTLLLNNWCSNQAGGSDAPGGCSTYRTSAVQSTAAHQLALLHPAYVRVVQKATKTAWGGGTRDDVIIQWKKAREGGPCA